MKAKSAMTRDDRRNRARKGPWRDVTRGGHFPKVESDAEVDRSAAAIDLAAGSLGLLHRDEKRYRMTLELEIERSQGRNFGNRNSGAERFRDVLLIPS